MLTEAHPDCDLGQLEVLSGVREFPSRVKCATLAWHTLHNAITRAGDTAVTE
jgi:nitrogen fixation NifU-like protein